MERAEEPTTMPTRIDLLPDLEAFTKACVASGRYSDTDDVIRTALRRLQDAESRRAAFNAVLDQTEADAAQNGTHDLDDVLAEVDAIIDEAVRANEPGHPENYSY
jgi:antitoxin ParD1/3/4